MFNYSWVEDIEQVHEEDRFAVGLMFVLEDGMRQTPKLTVAPFVSPRLNLSSRCLHISFFNFDLSQNQKWVEGSHPQ